MQTTPLNLILLGLFEPEQELRELHVFKKAAENLDEDLVQSSEKKNFKYYFSKVILFMGQAMTPFITVVYGAGMLRVVLSLVSYFAPAAAAVSYTHLTLPTT